MEETYDIYGNEVMAYRCEEYISEFFDKDIDKAFGVDEIILDFLTDVYDVYPVVDFEFSFYKDKKIKNIVFYFKEDIDNWDYAGFLTELREYILEEYDFENCYES